MVYGVRRDIREWYEKRPFNEESAGGGQAKSGILENLPIRPYACGLTMFRRRRQPGADQEISDDQLKDEDECQNSCGPWKANPREQSFQHQRVHNPAKAASSRSEASGSRSFGVEEMRNGCNGRCEDQGCSNTASDREGKEEVP